MLRDYFISTVSVSAFVALALGVSHPRLRSVTVFSSGVIIICAVLLPLVDILKEFRGADALDSFMESVDFSASDSAIELAFEDGVAEHVASRYGVPRECVSVRADGFDISTLSAERIYVTLSGQGCLIDTKRVESEVAGEFTRGGECEVMISFG